MELSARRVRTWGNVDIGWGFRNRIVLRGLLAAPMLVRLKTLSQRAVAIRQPLLDFCLREQFQTS